MSFKVNLFIAGAPKCGTTSIGKYLGQHPKICFSKNKEPNFFNTDFYQTCEDEVAYHSNFELGSQYTYYAEGSPLYLASAIAFQNIRAYNPNAKIILSFRSPVEAMYSAFLHNQYSTIENEQLFGNVLQKLELRQAWTKIPWDNEPPIRLQYNLLYDYAAQLKRCYHFFPKEQVYIVDFIDLKEKTDVAYHNLLDFLALDAYKVDLKASNLAKKNKSSSLAKVLRRPPKVVSQLGAILGSKNRHYLYKSLVSLNTSAAEKEEITNEKDLMKTFVERQVEDLYHLCNKDFRHWLC